MSFFLLRPAVFLLATVCAYPGRAQAEVASHNGMVFGPDSNGVCYEGSSQGPVTPCPTEVHPHLPKAAVAGIVIAVVFVIALLILLLLWRRRVRASTDDSASSLFDFVPAAKRLSLSTNANMSELQSRPGSPRGSVRTMIGSQLAMLTEKEVHESEESYFHHGSYGPEVDLEGSVETLTAVSLNSYRHRACMNM
ncbi:hypothetical protein F5050DRAFT_1881834 [Lentinula boryana]|uniref:Uncharacterized protein n=1 Tax=Lentinula boryana TaxID=40481 RepID=A0ABQ8QET5_9AGAR|nr:hypothetical protein F5050DRAFT_1881834 [Lentinula boryana]